MSAGAGSATNLREEIIACSSGGVELPEIERNLIDPAPVSEDEKAALWLLAWCKTSEGEIWPRSS
jgi:hypothetical protein